MRFKPMSGKTAQPKSKGGIFHNLFLAHPQSVGESYFQHLRFACWVASKLIWAGIAALIHALIPAFHQKTASKIIIELSELVQPRKS